MEALKPVLLSEVWQFTHVTTLNTPDNQSKVNNTNQKKSVNAVEQGKGKSKGKNKKCTTCNKFHEGECRQNKNYRCTKCTEMGAREDKIISHPNSECWTLHPEKITARLNDKILTRQAEEGCSQVHIRCTSRELLRCFTSL